MNHWTAPQRPNAYAEHTLINAILNHTFAAGTPLPSERELAAQLGITRPTLREALQRLARDGWLTVQQGKATIVNDIWRDGGLNILTAIVRHSEQLPPEFITHLLELRLQLAPFYTRQAVERAAETITQFLQHHGRLPENDPAAFAQFDWQLHRQLTHHGGNPIHVLILNGFADFYERLATLYFAQPEARAASQLFYQQLATAVAQQDASTAETITRQAMQRSIHLWQQSHPHLKEVPHETMERLGG